MKQLTLIFQAQDTWFFQELRPGNSAWLRSMFPPPARAFEGAVRALMQQACGRADALAGNLRMAGPWPCIDDHQQWQRLYPWPLHIVEQPGVAVDSATPLRATLLPSATATWCDMGRVRLPTLPAQCAQDTGKAWQAPQQTWLARDDFIQLLADSQASVKPIKLEDYVTREARLGIARVAQTALSDAGALYQTEHLRIQPPLGFAITLRVSPDKASGLADLAQEQYLTQLEQHIGSGLQVRLGAEGRMAQVSVLPDVTLDEAILPERFAGQNVILVATSAMDFNGNWLPQEFALDPGTPAGQAQSWSGVFHASGDRFNLRLWSAVIGKRVLEGSAIPGRVDDAGRKPDSARLGQGARALVPAGSVWFGQLLHGEFKRLARTRLGIGKKLGRGEFALATWKEGEA